ncbi:sulfite exporter TauE/SafE family protein [Paenalcaligenes sp. Me131]|uniref:sulfite exporter TauE/SafE family protein n=1 Tax=Paenalcaligenes sp. Me131 TaxID=3392636 RepID=UPI003D2C035E
MYWLLLGFGVLTGVTTVLFGFGGGFIVVPLLYTLLLALHGTQSEIGQAAMHIAVATSTCVMIFGTALATRRHLIAGTLRWDLIRPFLIYIAIGAVIGATAALNLNATWLRWAFIIYLILTILDSLFRPGFLHESQNNIRPMPPLQLASLGITIGGFAALLGVGGSVMTVPLMRRRGASMTSATAMANPLSLPMAISGTLTYMLLASRDAVSLGAWHIGYVDLAACLILVVGSWVGIRVAARWIGRIPDRIHAKIYIFLLCLVLGVMIVV